MGTHSLPIDGPGEPDREEPFTAPGVETSDHGSSLEGYEPAVDDYASLEEPIVESGRPTTWEELAADSRAGVPDDVEPVIGPRNSCLDTVAIMRGETDPPAPGSS